jgi:hypothetical protein
LVRIPLSLFALLPALASLGQPAIGPEVLSDPLPYVSPISQLAVPSVAMAKDRAGVAIAWMMPSAQGKQRIYVARLNATAHIEGAVREIPIALTASEVDAVYPSLAASVSGDGFTLAWTEQTPAQGVPAYCRLDAALKPSPPVLLFRAPAPAIVRSGKTATWITAGGLVWQQQKDDSVLEPLNGGPSASDMTVATDYPQLIGSRKTVVGSTCGPCTPDPHSWGCPEVCRINRYATNFTFTALYTSSFTVSFPFDSDAQPAVQSDGRDVLVAWFDGAQSLGGTVLATRVPPASFRVFPVILGQTYALGTFARDAGQTRPDIAFDGERYVVVWRTTSAVGDHDIVGSSLDSNGNVTPFTIAASSADERDPSIIAVGNGVFLVAYQKFNGGELRIAGRYITFSARRHAVR